MIISELLNVFHFATKMVKKKIILRNQFDATNEIYKRLKVVLKVESIFYFFNYLFKK